MNGSTETLNPFTAVWLRPRETARYIMEEKSSTFIFLLVVLGGFSAALLGNLDSEQGLPIGGILLIALLGGPIGAVVGAAIGAAIFLFVGKLFKGQGTYNEMFRAILTAQIPQIWLIPLLLIWLLFLPETFFLQSAETPFVPTDFISLAFTVIVAIVSIWTFIVQCKTIGEAHRLSSWKGFFIIAIPGLLFILLLTVLLFLIFWVAV